MSFALTRNLLNSLWVGTLRDYSLLRTDPDSDSLATSVSGVGMMSSRLGREVLLPVRNSRFPAQCDEIETVIAPTVLRKGFQ